MEKIPYLEHAVANIVKKLRETSGLSLRHFADFARLSHSGIRQYENGSRTISLNVLYLLSDAVKMSPRDLVDMIESERQSLIQLAGDVAQGSGQTRQYKP